MQRETLQCAQDAGARSTNRAKWPWKPTVIVARAPLRFLSTIRSASPTRAIVDLYQPKADVCEQILSTVRRGKIKLTSATLGEMTIRDQRPAKFLKDCMNDGVSPQDYLDALNGRVFFWLRLSRLTRLLNARLYRHSRHTVLHVDTARLVGAYPAGSSSLPTRALPESWRGAATGPVTRFHARLDTPEGRPVIVLSYSVTVI
jgi:hypothetical protein